MDQVRFLKQDYIPLLQSLAPDAERNWGKMNVQQMIEHMADSFRVANGKVPHTLVTDEAHVPKMQDFLRSDKPFKENTPNKLLGEEPAPVRHADVADSITELQVEIADFFTAFEQSQGHTVMNPFFGLLDFDLWVRLLYKHAWHHLRQFGVAEEAL